MKAPLCSRLLRYYVLKLKTVNLSTKIHKFIVSLSRYKGVSPYRDKNDTKKMDNIYTMLCPLKVNNNTIELT